MGKDDTKSDLEGADIAVLVAYFVGVAGVGVFSSFQNRGSVGGYFLAGQDVPWWLVGASLFASNIGSGHFVGLAGTAAASGIAISVFEIHAVYMLVLLGWLFVPVYKSAGVFTLPEYLYRRFGGHRIRMYMSIVSLLLYVFTKISADLFSGAIFLTQSIPGMNIYLSAILLILVSAAFTITGGLTAVLWTDFAQTVIMIVGSFILMGYSFDEVGGYEVIKDKFPKAFPQTMLDNMNNSNYSYKDCGVPPDNFFHLMHDPSEDDLPWTGVVFGLTVSGMWYWCSDQVIVQRALAAKNMVHAKMGCLMAGYLKVLPMWLIVFPGMISRILYTDDVACNEPDECEEICDSRTSCTNIAYPTLVLKLMPTGLKGLMIAVMMSALVSSLTSIFNSTATIFTIDIWTRIRKTATDMELMVIGRLCVCALVAVSVAWMPVIKEVSELFHYIQGITSYLAPPVCAVFILAVFWWRTTEKGAFWGLCAGLVVGMIRFVWEFSFPSVPCGEKATKEKPDIIAKVHYLHFGAILFAFVFIFVAVLSLLTEEPPEYRYAGLTYFTLNLPFIEHVEEDDLVQPVSGWLTETFGKVPYDQQPCLTRAFLWICGLESLINKPSSREEERSTMKTSVYEQPRAAVALHINCFLIVVFITVYWVCFA
ncbi:hypothetical protein C0Q70_03988 [Pomacea canaliculata]|uniref:Uncharacterized protein n=1 Tax=Pomacea canaliculata TaxID=400727 RepID=A0A2T7PU93_POMCA|nr:sodium/glucose cotransporter 4-like [Pomacea canaliculata]PVD36995.1 hypothetical protein C0Q70_03988 [Pomacea canaliculata]